MSDGMVALNAVTGKYQPRPKKRKGAAAMSRKPRLLDLFCCAGGAGVGCHADWQRG
jgi:hypothetical protein